MLAIKSASRWHIGRWGIVGLSGLCNAAPARAGYAGGGGAAMPVDIVAQALMRGQQNGPDRGRSGPGAGISSSKMSISDVPPS